MIKQEYQSKIINSIIFKTKITNKDAINAMHNISLEDVMLYYIDLFPKPANLKECSNQFAWIRKYAMHLLKKKGEHSTYLREIKDKFEPHTTSVV